MRPVDARNAGYTTRNTWRSAVCTISSTSFLNPEADYLPTPESFTRGGPPNGVRSMGPPSVSNEWHRIMLDRRRGYYAGALSALDAVDGRGVLELSG